CLVSYGIQISSAFAAFEARWLARGSDCCGLIMSRFSLAWMFFNFSQMGLTRRTFRQNIYPFRSSGHGSPVSSGTSMRSGMLNLFRRACSRQLCQSFRLSSSRTPVRKRSRARAHVEQLESRLAPAFFAVNSQLETTCLGGDGRDDAHAVVFFDSAVANY